jgi:hypothetical protein
MAGEVIFKKFMVFEFLQHCSLVYEKMSTPINFVYKTNNNVPKSKKSNDTHFFFLLLYQTLLWNIVFHQKSIEMTDLLTHLMNHENIKWLMSYVFLKLSEQRKIYCWFTQCTQATFYWILLNNMQPYHFDFSKNDFDKIFQEKTP